MDKPTGPRTFANFRPSTERVSDDNSETIIVKLPGFKKEQIKVKIDNYRNLRTSGYCPLPGDRWRHFEEDFHIPDTLDVDHIRAKFENETLYVTIPKFVAQPQAQEPPRAVERAPAQPRPSAAQTQKPGAAKLDDPKPPEATGAKKEKAPAELKPSAAQTQKPDAAKLVDRKPREKTEAKKEKEKAMETAPAEPKHGASQTQKPEAAKLGDPEPREATEATKEKEKASRVSSDEQKKVVEEMVDEGKGKGEVMGSDMRAGKSPEKSMNGVVGMMEGLQDKPSQLLMNAGAAVIVLVTIGIYLFYKVRGVTG